MARAVWVFLIVAILAAPAVAGPLSGAIFTTDEDGNRVNQNLYEYKEDVYLDGGPGPNAPSTAAGLPAGDYYFQVTDPSGKTLLSTDPVKCRKFTVGADGFITQVHGATITEKVKGKFVQTFCIHATGTDRDYGEDGAITVQLYPYKDTPNKGGVYKVWITPVDDFVGSVDEVDNPKYFHGFVPSCSKTDNFKVKKKGKQVTPALLEVIKFNDKDTDGAQDEGEEEITGWKITITDPLGVVNTCYTPVSIYVDPGTYTVEEETRDGSVQTVALLDDVKKSSYPNADPKVTVVVDGDNGETHEIVFGNVGLGKIGACKFYDRNLNKVWDDGEPGVAGWRMKVEGTDTAGRSFGPVVATTGEGGCVLFANLLPGTYVVTELMAGTGETGTKWVASTATSFGVTLISTVSGGVLSGSAKTVKFGNYCTGATADFGTKGYWHNKNGLAELMATADHFADVLDYVNGLDPYDSATGYFGKGDEPFDGKYANGAAADAAKGVLENESIAPAGTPQAEISNFLIDSNGNGGAREQLAQQLLAFIFNTIHRFGGVDTCFEKTSGTWVSAADLIDDAIDAWASGTDSERVAIKNVLDTLNNSDAVGYVPYLPCKVVYSN